MWADSWAAALLSCQSEFFTPSITIYLQITYLSSFSVFVHATSSPCAPPQLYCSPVDFSSPLQIQLPKDKTWAFSFGQSKSVHLKVKHAWVLWRTCSSFLDSTSRASDLVGLGWGQRTCILTSSQVMLLQGPHLENHLCGEVFLEFGWRLAFSVL